MIIGTQDAHFTHKRDGLRRGKHNGAYYYAQEIENNIIPRIKTNMNWVLVRPEQCPNNSIVFIHSNVNLDKLDDWLGGKKNLILVCSIESTRDYCKKFGESILLPLSVDVDYVKQFKCEKTRDAAYCGNLWKFKHKDFLELVKPGTHILTDIPREQMLQEMAKYKSVYAVGRCAIEARVLGCDILYCDSRYPDPSIWKIYDNKDAAENLNAQLKSLGVAE